MPQDPYAEFGAPIKPPAKGDPYAEFGDPVAQQTPPPQTGNDRLFKGMGTEPATISAAPTGVKAWLQNAENDFRRGGQSTIVGKILHAAGANPNGVDSGTGSYAADTVASVPLGLLHAAQGVAETPEHPLMGPLHALGGVAQAATIPAAFIAPETQALKDASAASQVRQAILPTKQEVGKLFQPIEAAAKDTPVNLTDVRRIAEEAQRSDAAGGGAPPVIKKFLKRTEPTPANFPSPAEPAPAMNYPEARLFAQNSGRLSASDKMAANGPMQRLVGEFAAALKDANRAAAEKVGMGEEYDQAMKRYASVAKRDEFLGNLKKIATDAVVKHGATAVGLGAGGALAYKLLSDKK
jgi:hypothetical protein